MDVFHIDTDTFDLFDTGNTEFVSAAVYKYNKKKKFFLLFYSYYYIFSNIKEILNKKKKKNKKLKKKRNRKKKKIRKNGKKLCKFRMSINSKLIKKSKSI